MNYPNMIPIRQEFPSTALKDVPAAVRAELGKLPLQQRIPRGARVAITAGSRGISNMAVVLATLVEELKRVGARPFIVPAMGSHGGATPEGQRSVLEHYGITEENIGAPIRATMEVVKVSTTPEGIPVFLDRYAYEADRIVVVNRVKAHTDFKGSIESGLMKMMTIGLGKQKGADLYHRGFVQHGYYRIIVSVAREVLKRCPVAFGLALVENARKETAIVRAIPSEEIEETERKLLRRAKRLMARLPFDAVDLLIVDRMGKEISGTGCDTNVIGRSVIPFAKFPPKPKILRIFVRDLTDQSYGNATGIGNVDIATTRLVRKIDPQATYMNCISASAPEMARVPPHFDTDQEALHMAFRTLGLVEPQEARIVHIVDTLNLEEMEISEALLAEAQAHPRVRITGPPKPLSFDSEGNLISSLSPPSAY
jgi:hypothetical protein